MAGATRLASDAIHQAACGTIGFSDTQQLLYSVLKAQGNPVSLDVMPSSSHASLAGQGCDVFMAAFPKATSPR